MHPHTRSRARISPIRSAQYHSTVPRWPFGGEHDGPHAHLNQRAVRSAHDKVLKLSFLLGFYHKRAMVALFAISRAIRSLKKGRAEFVQDGIAILPQHAASRFIDCHNATILINKNNPFVEIVENLLQFRQGDHIRQSNHKMPIAPKNAHHEVKALIFFRKKANSPRKCGLSLNNCC